MDDEDIALIGLRAVFGGIWYIFKDIAGLAVKEPAQQIQVFKIDVFFVPELCHRGFSKDFFLP